MKYKIWNKTDPVLTASGAVFTAEQWMEKYPIAKMNNVTVVCADSELNGSYFGTLGSMIERFSKLGVDFSSYVTDDEKICAINEYLENRESQLKEYRTNKTDTEELSATSLASIAASLEYQNLTTLDDIEEVESNTDENISQGVAKVSGNIATSSEETLSVQGERISAHFTAGLWSIPMVKVAVKKGAITKNEFQLITGEEYK